MRNPWLDIPLRDYEAHMSLPSVGQSKVLGDQFEQLMARKSPASVAIIGCAGGNGLERIIPGRVLRVVAVDLNPEYLKETGNRFATRLPSLELQLPYPGHDAVSPSPFKTLSVLAPVIRHIEPATLCAAAAEAGFTAEDSRTIEAASGKRFWLQTFQATAISTVIGE